MRFGTPCLSWTPTTRSNRWALPLRFRLFVLPRSLRTSCTRVSLQSNCGQRTDTCIVYGLTLQIFHFCGVAGRSKSPLEASGRRLSAGSAVDKSFCTRFGWRTGGTTCRVTEASAVSRSAEIRTGWIGHRTTYISPTLTEKRRANGPITCPVTCLKPRKNCYMHGCAGRCSRSRRATRK